MLTNSNIETILLLMKEGGDIAKGFLNKALTIEIKDDGSPVSNVDKSVSKLLVGGLSQILPNVPIISEEEEMFSVGSCFWLVDPIDGTKHYIQGQDEYTINVGLIWNNIPLFGFIYYPSQEVMYYTTSDGAVVSEKNKQKFILSPAKNEEVKIVVKKDNLDKNSPLHLFMKANNIQSIAEWPNIIRIRLVLTGEADIYWLDSGSKEWDTAAWHALLRAMGGDIVDFKGTTLGYNKAEFTNPSGLVALNKKALHIPLNWHYCQ